MKILLANIVLAERSGTEVVTVELARALVRRGHDVCVFAADLGETASTLTRAGIPVVDDLLEVPFEPEVVHGNQNVPLIQALMRFRSAAGVYVCHDAVFWLNEPPELTRIRAFVAVDRICCERIERALPRARGLVEVIHNAVDLKMYSPRTHLPERPRRVLILTKQGQHVEALKAACARRGLEATIIGSGVGIVVDDLHQRLHHYDIVFATARMAIEALAVGCAVVVCDARGLAGMVTRDNVGIWRNDNFGLRLLTAEISVDALIAEIDRYDASSAGDASRVIRERHSLDDAVSDYERVYRQAVAANQPVDPDDEAKELSKLLRDWLPTIESPAPLRAGRNQG